MKIKELYRSNDYFRWFCNILGAILYILIIIQIDKALDVTIMATIVGAMLLGVYGAYLLIKNPCIYNKKNKTNLEAFSIFFAFIVFFFTIGTIIRPAPVAPIAAILATALLINYFKNKN